MRARNLKPGFFMNPELADAGMACQLLFAGLWLLADKEGRLKDQPRVIKAQLFPFYEVDVNGELTVLERLGFIRRYQASGIAVVEVLKFKEHQSPHHTEKASTLPPYDSASACKTKEHENNGEVTVSSPLLNGGNPSDSLIPDSLIQCKTPAPREPKRKVSLPDDFTLTPDLSAQALTKLPDADVAAMFDQFRAHHIAHGSLMKSWPAAWTTWIGNAARFGYPKKSARKWQ